MKNCSKLVFLRYTGQTPNFPSRILGYMEMSLPILSCTDPVTDVGKVIEDGGFGWSCLSNNTDSFKETIKKVISCDVISYGKRGRKYLEDNYTSSVSYEIIMDTLAGDF